jgi:nucleotide-binding universal stress UspA family protein
VFESMGNIVVGANSSETARRAVAAAADLARLTGGSLHIVAAVEPEQGPNRSGVGGYIDPGQPAATLLESLAEIAKERGLEPTVHACTGMPAEAVVNVADELDADLIVVGNKGMKVKGARRVLGSIPNSIAHNAPCSVLIVDTIAAD